MASLEHFASKGLIGGVEEISHGGRGSIVKRAPLVPVPFPIPLGIVKKPLGIVKKPLGIVKKLPLKKPLGIVKKLKKLGPKGLSLALLWLACIGGTGGICAAGK